MRKHLLHRIIIIVIVLLEVHSSEAQQTIHKNSYEMQSDMPYFETYLQDLPSAQINDIMEDDDGFLWVSTNNGVARFDGLGYSLYGHMEGRRSANGLIYYRLFECSSNNSIIAIRKDGLGFLSIDKTTKQCTFVPYKTTDGETISISLTPSNVVTYNDTTLLNLSLNVLRRVDMRTGVVIASDTIRIPKENRSATRLVDAYHNSYVVYNGRLCNIEEKDGHLVLNMRDLGIEQPIVNAFEVSNNDFYIVSWDSSTHSYSFTRVNPDNNKSDLQFYLNGTPKGIVEMDDGIWIGTNSGLYFYSYNKKSLAHYSVQNSQLHNPHILSIAKSKHQPIMWVGTIDGLVKNDYYSSKFSYYDIYKYSDIVEGNVLKVIKDGQGGYWLSILKDLYHKRNNSAKFEKETLNGLLHENETHIDPIYAPHTGKVYISEKKSIFEYDPVTEKSRLVYNGDLYIKTQLCQPMGNKLVWCDNEGLVLLDLDTYKYHRKKISSKGEEVSSSVKSICADGDSLLWIAYGRKSLIEYNVANDVFIWHDNLPEETDENITFKDLRVIYRDGGQRELWLLGSNGLYYYLPDRAKLQKIEYSPFFSYAAQTLFVDNYKNIWVGSEYGLACINNTDGRTYEYSNQAYRIPRKIQNFGACESADGSMLVSGEHSFVEFSVKNFASNDYFPTPEVVEYQYMDAQSVKTDVLTRTWETTNSDSVLMVPRGIRSVKLATRVLNYSKSETNVVEWRREGDPLWRETNTSIPIVLSNLDAGWNVIELRTKPIYTNEIVFADTRKYYIYKDVYFYQEKWFKSIVAAIILILIVTGWHASSRIQRNQKKKLEQEISKQTIELNLTCSRLKIAQDRVEKQNKDLRALTENLEVQVKERTADLEREKARIEEASNLKSAFLANLSHEVRTPMNCIVGFSKLLSDPTCTKEECAEFAHLIRESANSLLTLLGDLLDVSRIETGQMRINLTVFPVLKDLQDIYKMLLVEKKKPDVEFLLNTSSKVSDVVLYLDRDRFKQILINLVYNAFKFTDKGHVAITAAVVERKDLRQFDFPKTYTLPTANKVLLLSVEDTGIGMPADKIDIIFEPFRKLNNNKTLYPGLGLGLNICKNLILMLDGQIWVKSTLNFGSTFLFYFPIAEDEG